MGVCEDPPDPEVWDPVDRLVSVPRRVPEVCPGGGTGSRDPSEGAVSETGRGTGRCAAVGSAVGDAGSGSAGGEVA